MIANRDPGDECVCADRTSTVNGSRHPDPNLVKRGNWLRPEFAPRFGEMDLATGEFFSDPS